LEDLRPRLIFDDWALEMVDGVPQLAVTSKLRPERLAEQLRARKAAG
jgi:hypothetical protein